MINPPMTCVDVVNATFHCEACGERVTLGRGAASDAHLTLASLAEEARDRHNCPRGEAYWEATRTSGIILPSTLRYVIELATIQVDQWDNVEEGRGPDLDNLRERGETLIDILRDVSELPLPPLPSRLDEHAGRINDIAREPWLAPSGPNRSAVGQVEARIADYLRRHFLETVAPEDESSAGCPEDGD